MPPYSPGPQSWRLEPPIATRRFAATGSLDVARHPSRDDLLGPDPALGGPDRCGSLSPSVAVITHVRLPGPPSRADPSSDRRLRFPSSLPSPRSPSASSQISSLPLGRPSLRVLAPLARLTLSGSPRSVRSSPLVFPFLPVGLFRQFCLAPLPWCTHPAPPGPARQRVCAKYPAYRQERRSFPLLVPSLIHRKGGAARRIGAIGPEART